MKNYLRCLSTLMLLLAVLFGGGNCFAKEVTVTQTTFTSVSADNIGGDKHVSYSTAKGNGTAAPQIKNNEIKLYQNQNGKYGGTITIKATAGATIKSISIGSSLKTKVAYSLDKSSDQSAKSDLAADGKYVVDNLSASSVTFYCWGTSSSSRLYVNYLSVTYEDDGKTSTSISFAKPEGYTFTKGDNVDNFTNLATLTPAEAGAVTYSSDNENVAVVNETTGEVTVDTKNEGKATITATFSGNDNYSASSASYDINIVKPQLIATSISFEKDAYTFDLNSGEYEFTNVATLTPAEAGTVTYSSDNENIAVVNENTGEVYVVTENEGTATITATFAETDTHAGATASYTIKVAKPQVVEDGVFDFTGDGTVDYGSGLKPKNSYGQSSYDNSTSWTAGNVTVNTKGKTRWWDSDTNELRFYNGSSFTVSVPENSYITNIVLTGAYSFKANTGTFNANSGKWNGLANSVTLTYNAKSGNIGVQTITVTYMNTETLTTSSTGYATYAADYAVNYSELGLTAYAITVNADKQSATAKEFTGVVPAGKAVLVKGETSKDYVLTPATATADDTFVTALQCGSVTTNGTQYGFSSKNGNPTFYRLTSGQTIPEKKGYLVLSSESAAKLSLGFEDEATGIKGVETEAANAHMYNLAGQRVDKAFKGIVIVNGKKYLNK